LGGGVEGVTIKGGSLRTKEPHCLNSHGGGGIPWAKGEMPWGAQGRRSERLKQKGHGLKGPLQGGGDCGGMVRGKEKGYW